MAESKSPIFGLHEQGQSVWLDYIRRGIIEDGELERMIAQYDLRGVTSNPSIFEEAIGKSNDYDAAFDAAEEGATAGKVYELAALEDIRAAADVFRPVFDATDGNDGFVSLEVSPELADDADATIEEARRLWHALGRRNVMIKVPGTAPCIPAIEQLIAEGINVNVTLLFSLANYEKVMEAYLRGLERRAETGGALGNVNSVASFFVSRVDVAVDAKLAEMLKAETDPAKQEKIRSVMGRAAIDNAKMAYARFREIFSGERWERLCDRGAKVQRPLWASTSTKNPEYRDVVYVEELIGPDTVNTIPLATVKAFADHGVVARTVDADMDRARAELKTLAELGIDLGAVTEQLQVEGVEKFAKAFSGMIATVGEKLKRVAAKA